MPAYILQDYLLPILVGTATLILALKVDVSVERSVTDS